MSWGGVIRVDTVEGGPSSGCRCTAEDEGDFDGWNHSPCGKPPRFGDVFKVDVRFVFTEQLLSLDLDISIVVLVLVLARGEF